MRSFVLCFTVLLLFAMSSSAMAQASCDDFTSQGQAQFALDPDRDGIACEDLPTSSEVPGQTEASTASSQGLGLTGEEWIEIFGDPIETEFDDVVTSFGSPELRIDFVLFEADRHVTDFSIQFAEAIDMSDAEGIVQAAIPTDSEELEIYPAPFSESRVVLYHSDWLASEIEPDPELEALGLEQWINADPGDFIAIYGWDQGDPATGKVSQIIIAIGNNP